MQDRRSEPGPGAVADIAAGVGQELTEAQAEALATYLRLLQQWNRSTNLVGPRDWEIVMRTLVVDSFHLARVLEDIPLPEEPTCLDLGAGAGLPGLPLRIIWTRGRWVLVEPRRKRMAFLLRVLGELSLPGTVAVESRLEELPKAFLPADVVTGRAFLPWRELLTSALGLLAPGGRVVVFSNDRLPEDVPAPYGLEVEHAYRVEGADRYVSVFIPASISR
jgi:16S rRNA (guanine527-N7)-methyltransferase